MNEVKHHLAEPNAKMILNEIPGCYGYWASEWQSDEVQEPIVVLELSH